MERTLKNSYCRHHQPQHHNRRHNQYQMIGSIARVRLPPRLSFLVATGTFNERNVLPVQRTDQHRTFCVLTSSDSSTLSPLDVMYVPVMDCTSFTLNVVRTCVGQRSYSCGQKTAVTAHVRTCDFRIVHVGLTALASDSPHL